MSRYHLELTSNERMLLIFALGCCPQHAILSDHSDPPAVPIELARRLVESIAEIAPAPFVSSRPMPPPAPAAVHMSEPSKDPAVFPLGPIIPQSIVKQGTGDRERLVIEWRHGKNVKRASCWMKEKAIWPRVLERVKQSTVFLAKESKGYIHIVGVKV